MCEMELEKAICVLFDCYCDVYYNEEVIKDGLITGHKRKKVFEEIKCRISYKNGTRKLLSTKQTTKLAEASQGVKLFLPKDIEIKEGSEIVVFKKGKELKFKYSGIEACYDGHKEIVVERMIEA